MQIDLRTVAIEPKRQAFDHLVRRFGDKPASRYQEGSYDLQAAENLHYRPTWDPEQALYDTGITRIVMQDWYALKDPRQFYYNTWVLARAKSQETAEANFGFVESRDLAAMLPAEVLRLTLDLLMPLRHAGWAANMNNTFVCAYGYGVVFTQACMYHAADNLAIAQYLTRLGLLLGGEQALVDGRAAWMQAPAWQALRHYAEDCLVTRDPFELFLAQNLVLDGLLYPLVYAHVVDERLALGGGAQVAMLTQFMSEWSVETRRWVDAIIATAAKESAHNREVLAAWFGQWAPRAKDALEPLMTLACGSDAGPLCEDALLGLTERVRKAGVQA